MTMFAISDFQIKAKKTSNYITEYQYNRKKLQKKKKKNADFLLVAM